MGLNSSKSSLTNTEYSLILSSSNHFYRNLTNIQGEIQLNIHGKLLIEKKIRIDLIGQLIEKQKKPSNSKLIFFTYSFPIVTSRENGMARIIKERQITFPFRIPLGINLPPSCQFQEFSIIYYLDVYHDGRSLSNLRTEITLAPPAADVTIPLPYQLTGSNDVTIICSLQKSFYSARDDSIVPLSISITNPQEKHIYSVSIQLIEMITLNGMTYENDLLTTVFNETTRDKQSNRICEYSLPANLSPTYIPNQNGQPDNLPSIRIIYEFRLTAQIEGIITPNLRLSIPIGIE